MKPQQKQNRKTIDQELRKTHYTLGYDRKNNKKYHIYKTI